MGEGVHFAAILTAKISKERFVLPCGCETDATLLPNGDVVVVNGAQVSNCGASIIACVASTILCLTIAVCGAE
jgi:hypothetical protein